MDPLIKEICAQGKQFWYPEIEKFLKASEGSKLSPSDLHTLFITREFTLINRIKAVVIKIIHQIKYTISKSYRIQFEEKVFVLVAYEKKKNPQSIRIRAAKNFLFKTRLKKLIETEKLEYKKKEEAVRLFVQCYRTNKIQKQYKVARDRIRKESEKINQEMIILDLLTQFIECHKHLHQLNQAKGKGVIALFKRENKAVKATRKNLEKHLPIVIEQIQKTPAISWILTAKSEKKPEELADQERKQHEDNIHECNKSIGLAKAQIFQLT